MIVPGDGVTVVSGWMLRTSFQASVLVLVILGLQALLRHRLEPRWRYGLWFVLVLQLLLPWTPESSWSLASLLRGIPGVSEVSRTGEGRGPATVSLKERREFQGAAGYPEQGTRPLSAFATPPAQDLPAIAGRGLNPEVVPVWSEGTGVAASVAPRLPRTGAGAHPGSPWGWGILAWAVGAFLLVVVTGVQALGPALAIGRRRFLTDQSALELLEDCKEEMGIRAYLAVVETPRVKSPALFGFIRPRLLLPPGTVEALGPERLRHVFLHELAHLKRHDIPVHWLLTALQILHWFNPLIWYAFSRMRADRELACDALVLACTRHDEAPAYGRTIVHLIEVFSRPPRVPNWAGILEDLSQIQRRIDMITTWKPVSRPASLAAAVLVILLACVALPEAKNEETKKEAKATLPDLVVEDFNLMPYPEGGLYEAAVAIRNQGGKAAPAFDVHFLRDGPGKSQVLIQGARNSAGPIEPDKTWNEGSTPFALHEGENELVVMLDPDKKVEEAERSNNRGAMRIVVEGGRIVERSVWFRSFEDKIAQVDIENAALDDVVRLFGEPREYVWENRTFTRDQLPAAFLCRYPDGFDVFFRDGKIMELRFYKPWHRFRDAIHVGSSLDEVLTVVGQPKETVTGGKNEYKENVLYKDIDGRKGYGYYECPEAHVRIFFTDDTVAALYVTRGDFSGGGPDPKAALMSAVRGMDAGGSKVVRTLPVTKDCMVLAYMPQWRYGDVDNIAVADNDSGVRTLIAWPEIPKEDLDPPARRVCVALFSRKTTLTAPGGTIEVRPLLADWPERTAWVDQPTAAEKPASTQPMTPGEGWKLFDVTSLVRSQAAQNLPGFGIQIRFSEEDRDGNKGNWSGYAFVSREGEGPWSGFQPVLVVVEPTP